MEYTHIHIHPGANSKPEKIKSNARVISLKIGTGSHHHILIFLLQFIWFLITLGLYTCLPLIPSLFLPQAPYPFPLLLTATHNVKSSHTCSDSPHTDLFCISIVPCTFLIKNIIFITCLLLHCTVKFLEPKVLLQYSTRC